MFFYILFSSIVIILLGYCFKMYSIEEFSNNKNDCQEIGNIKTRHPISSIDYDNEIYCHDIRDFYIKTAYNCCATGDFKNGYVDLCALKNCIKQGVRCLDICIYNIDGSPEVAISNDDSFMLKGSWNSIPLEKVFTEIADSAFNPNKNVCPNPTDPLFLHLRIKSAEDKIYTKVANLIQLILNDRLLDVNKYGREFYCPYMDKHKNLGALPLNHSDIQRKLIIMVEMNNEIELKDTHLDKYTNIMSVPMVKLNLEKKKDAPPFLISRRNSEVVNSHSLDDIQNSNKKYMSICLPDYSDTPNNPSSGTLKTYGCQFIGQCFQHNDSNLQAYNDFFKNKAFILKKEYLRYVKQYIKKPKPPPEKEGLGKVASIDLIGPAGAKKKCI